MRGEREALRGRVPSVRRGDGHGARERSQPPPQSTTADNVRERQEQQIGLLKMLSAVCSGGPQTNSSRAQPGQLARTCSWLSNAPGLMAELRALASTAAADRGVLAWGEFLGWYAAVCRAAVEPRASGVSTTPPPIHALESQEQVPTNWPGGVVWLCGVTA